MDNGLVHYDDNHVEFTDDYGLNPYCSGQWSRTAFPFPNKYKVLVLILIVVDNGLVQTNRNLVFNVLKVLILIVVDNGLVLDDYEYPYNHVNRVLILIVVDNGLVLF